MSFILSETKRKFLASDEAAWAAEQLQKMVDDPQYNTPEKVSYATPEVENMSFVDWNLRYLCEHPQIRVQDYLSNLRLKTKIR